MTFEVSSELNVSVNQSGLKTARNTIEQELQDVTVGVDSSGISSGFSSGSAVTDGGTDVGKLLEEQTEILDDVRDTLEKGAVSGGGAGGGGLLDSLTGGGGIGLTDILGVTSFGSLVRGVSLRSLLTKIPTFTALVGTGYLASEFIQGDLTASDIVDTAINIGDIFTGGLVESDLLKGTIGAAALTGGGIQIGQLIAGKLSGSALAGYLGSTSIGGILTSLGSGAAAAGGVTLATLLGSTALGTLLTDDDVNPADHIAEMEFREALVDAGKANIAVADYITPAPLDEFVEDQVQSADQWWDDISNGGDGNSDGWSLDKPLGGGAWLREPLDERWNDYQQGNFDDTTTVGTEHPEQKGVVGESASDEESQRADDIATESERADEQYSDDTVVTDSGEVISREEWRERTGQTEENRASGGNKRQEVDIRLDGNLTVDEAQRYGYNVNEGLPPEVKQRILDEIARELDATGRGY